MATNTAGSSARAYSTAQTHIISLPYTFSTLLATASAVIGTVPAGAAIVRIYTAVVTAFNAGTLSQFSVGTVSGGAQLVATAALNTVGINTATVLVSASQVPQVDQQIWLTNQSTGTAATTGNSTVYVEYLIPDSVAV